MTSAPSAMDFTSLQPFHTSASGELLSRFGSQEDVGLATAAVEPVRLRYGWNELNAAPPEPAWRRFLWQFNDLLVWILIAAAMVSGVTGEWTDAAVIVAIVLLNAILGFFQEERAEQALSALQKMAAPAAHVVRDGQRIHIPARELVPGDVLELEAGDSVPADARLLSGFELRIQEASLTGESVPVDKNANVVLSPETPLADRRNMTYMSTVVANGTARALIVATGMQTEIGRIARLLERSEREPTPLQRQLAAVGRTLVIACLTLVALVFVLSLWRGDRLLGALMTAISLAVAAVPEGLPAVVTLALALGLQRIVKRNALIRKLPSVETLGCVTVICSDKTGTLTRNEMTVREVLAGGSKHRVTGSGYAPQGEFLPISPSDVTSSTPAAPQADADLSLALQIVAACSNAEIQPDVVRNSWKVIGDPTEGALVVAAMKAGVAHRGARVHVLDELPFDSDRKLMSVLVRDDEGLVQYTKGAPEELMNRCSWELQEGRIAPLAEDRRGALRAAAEEMAQRALRVLACGLRRDQLTVGDIREENLTFVGLFGMIDPPRDEVAAAVERCREAGIRTVMITGDHPLTAAAIGRELGITKVADEILTGSELDRLGDDALAERAEHIAIYARVAPEHKLRIVQALKAHGHVVAMTGDGVNDAPAVKAADIGIAMGITGTDVTREAAAMILVDDNFTSIVNAVEEGRAIYDNIQKFLAYLLSCNAGEMLLMLIAGVLGWPAPLLPIHLLWINLVSDGLPALALAMEPPEPDLMRRRPRAATDTMLSWSLGGMILGQGLILTLVGQTAFGVGWSWSGNLDQARTMTFSVVVFGELFRALAARSNIWTFWQLRAETNLYLFVAVVISSLLQFSIIALPSARPIFEVTSHSLEEWMLLIVLALLPVTIIEVIKLVRQAVGRNAIAA